MKKSNRFIAFLLAIVFLISCNNITVKAQEKEIVSFKITNPGRLVRLSSNAAEIMKTPGFDKNNNETVGNTSTVIFDWDNSQINKNDIVALRIQGYFYCKTYMEWDEGMYIAKTWGAPEKFCKEGENDYQYKYSEQWYNAESDQNFALWIKDDSFEGLKISAIKKYYNDLYSPKEEEKDEEDNGNYNGGGGSTYIATFEPDVFWIQVAYKSGDDIKIFNKGFIYEQEKYRFDFEQDLLPIEQPTSEQPTTQQPTTQKQQDSLKNNTQNTNKNVHSNRLTKNIFVTFRDGALGDIYSLPTTYSDVFFDRSSTKVYDDLARLSVLASSTAYTIKLDKKLNKKNYAIKMMKDCEFKSIKSYYNAPKENKNNCVQYIFGKKDLGDYTLIAVWIKGTSGDYEWVSNFDIGNGSKQDVHKGFLVAKNALKKDLDKYTRKIKGKKKFWITGHSRGAAVGNLLAKDLTDKYKKQNVFAYTFATPRVSVNGKEKGYNNIFNFLERGDFVTELAPARWGYKRYGVDINMSKNDENEMKKRFKELTGKRFEGYGKEGRDDLVRAFTNYAGNNRLSYYKSKTYIVTKTNSYAVSYQTEAKYKPCEFFKGLGEGLAGNNSGYFKALEISKADPKAAKVLAKMFIDSGAEVGKMKFKSKLNHAHCQCAYIAWIESDKFESGGGSR